MIFEQNPISIHALVKRATQADICRLHTLSDFNPRPREEGDLSAKVEKTDYGISIHALVKRATPYIDVSFASIAISIHALVKRATWRVPCVIERKIFQSTPS